VQYVQANEAGIEVAVIRVRRCHGRAFRRGFLSLDRRAIPRK
jgi:hypothetical protein